MYIHVCVCVPYAQVYILYECEFNLDQNCHCSHFKHFTAEIEQGWFVYIHVCLCMCAYACVYVHMCMLRRVPVLLCGELCSGVTSERLCSPWQC